MKKLIALLLALVMVLSLAACGAKEEAAPEAAPETEAAPEAATEAAPEAEAEPEAAAEPLKIGYLGWDLSQAWNIATLDGLEYGAEMMGCTIEVADSRGDVEAQISQAEQMINSGVDYLALFPVTVESGATIVRMANEAGIPIAIENSILDASSGDMVGQVACQYGDIGYAAVKWAAENIEGAKMLYVTGGLGMGITELYQEGVQKGAADFSDKLELVGEVNGEWTLEGCYDVTSGFIGSGKEFNVIFAQDDVAAKGAYQAVSDAGLDIPIISTGGSDEGYTALEKGENAANMTAPAHLQGLILFGMIWADNVGADWGEDTMALPVVPIDANNIGEWLYWDDMEGGYAYISEAIAPYPAG